MTEGPGEALKQTWLAWRLVPPHVHKNLLKDEWFKEEYGLSSEAVISLEAFGVSFKSTAFFAAVREVIAGRKKVVLSDTEDRKWSLSLGSGGEDAPNELVLESNGEQVTLPDFSVLSNDPSTRIRHLLDHASRVNLPVCARKKWRAIMEQRPLEDEEVDLYFSDLGDTPIEMEREIRARVMKGESSISSLVPRSKRFYDRLVGAYDGSNTIQDYAVGGGREACRQLEAWRPYEGFLFSLLLSSHSALSNEIRVDSLDSKCLLQAFEFIESQGDVLSQLGACEVGLRVLSARPEVESWVLRLIRRIRDDNAEDDASMYRLFYSLFVLVDGELARTRLMANEPPFYRRLASLAHAALLHRQLLRCGVDIRKFSGAALRSRGEYFYMQSLVDMRVEPRWSPDFSAPPQLRAEFLGRISNVGQIFETTIGDGELRKTIFGEGEQGLLDSCEKLTPFFPGPLEGAEYSPTSLPAHIASIIEEELEKEEISASSFIALANAVMVFRITPAHAELAAKAIRLGNYMLVNVESRSQLLGILNSLASVAAVSRNQALADELRILARRYRHDTQYRLSAEEAMRIGLVASAARESFAEWGVCVGEWLTELSFDELEEGDGVTLYSHLGVLLQLVPELWASCSKADAALRAWRHR